MTGSKGESVNTASRFLRSYWRSKRDRKTASLGMTLVEVLVTMGIASGLILAVMEAVTYTQKMVRRSQTNNDWVSLVSMVRNMTIDAKGCTDLVTGTIIPNNPPTGSPWELWENRISAKTADSSAHAAVYLHEGVNTGLFRATTIELVEAPGNATQVVPGGGGLVSDRLLIRMAARRLDPMGTPIEGELRSGYTDALGNPDPGGITFMVYRDPTTGVIRNCASNADPAELACKAMHPNADYLKNRGGGTLPDCLIPELRNLNQTGTALYSDANSVTGQRLQLNNHSGTLGSRSTSDAAIGMSSTNNALTGTGGHVWLNTGGANTGLAVTNTSGTINALRLDPVGKLILGDSAAASAGMLSFGQNNASSIGAPTALNGHKIQLWSGTSPGTANAADYAIGIEDFHMWFSNPNAIGNNSGLNGFKFYNNNGTSALGYISSLYTQFDSSYGLYIGTPNPWDNYVLWFGPYGAPDADIYVNNTTGDMGIQTPTNTTKIFIRSAAVTSAQPSVTMDHGLEVYNQLFLRHRLSAGGDTGGVIWFGDSPTGTAVWGYGTNGGAAASNLYLHADNSINFETGGGWAVRMYIDSAGTVGIYGNVIIDGGILMNWFNTGSNVPHNCWTHIHCGDAFGSACPMGNAAYNYATCPSSAKVVSGGVDCYSGGTMNASYPRVDSWGTWVAKCSGNFWAFTVNCCYF